jgi:hypothetical protein
LLLATVPAHLDHPRTYLVSIAGLPLAKGERLSGFSFETWGVTFNAVCHIPRGWTIKAGGRATPDGVLEGEASLGTTWIGRKGLRNLRGLALVTLYGPVQPGDVGDVPATFKGSATVETDDGDRKAPLTVANIRLVPALRCPDPRT